MGCGPSAKTPLCVFVSLLLIARLFVVDKLAVANAASRAFTVMLQL